MKDQIKKIGFLVILVFLVRFVSIFILKLYDLSFISFSEYDVIASNILSGKGYVYYRFNTNCYFFGPSPLYAYFLALVHLITNKNYLMLQIIQSIISAFSVIPLIFLAKKIFNEKTALIVGLLYCFHPGFIFYNIMVHEFTLTVFFILTILYLMVYYSDKRWSLVSIGILTGLGILIRVTILFVIPAFFIYLILKKERIKKIFLKLFIILLLAIIVISPWIYRGYKIYNRFIFITLSSAEHLWRGNNPLASGTSYTKDGDSILSAAGEDFRNKLFSLNEIEQNDFFKEEAIKYIKTHPLDFFKLTFKKFIYFWSFSPQTGQLYSRSWLIIYKLLYYSLAFFFVLGVYFILKNRYYVNISILVFLFIFFMMTSFVHSLYYVETRHRWMIEPLLMIVTSYGIQKIFSKNKGLV